MSLRTRLALLYVLLAAPALATFAIVVFLIAHKQVYASVDNGLRSRSAAITSSLAHVSGPLTPTDITLSAAALDRQAIAGDAFDILDTTGRVLYSSSHTSAGVPIERLPRSGSYQTITLDEDRVRTYLTPIIRLGQTNGYVETRTSLAQTEETLGDLRWVLALGGLSIAVLIGLPSYFLAGRALQPVSSASRLAREIEATGDFSRRLPEVRGRGDLAELTSTLNNLIQRVDQMMAAQRDFLAESSHELRRPLTIIRTNIDVMNDPRLSPEDRESIEKEMRAEAQAMSRLITDLLLLAREQRVEMKQQRFNLTAVCEHAIEVTKLRFGDRHVFDVSLEPGLEYVGDQDQFLRVLENLLENACIYTPGAGRVTFDLRREADSLHISVSDNGVGISEADQPRIFDRFYRAAGSQAIKPDGFGLGLAIVKHVVVSHGGTIALLSREGAGSMFSIDLPILDPPPQEGAQPIF